MPVADTVAGLNNLHIPEALGAALVLAGLLGITGLGVYLLSGPAADWIARAPASVSRVEGKLRALRKPVDQVSRTADQMEKSIAGQTGAPNSVEVKGPGLKEAVFGGTGALLSGGLVVVVLLYFLLASGDLFLRKLVNVLPTLSDKKRAVEMAREMEKQVSTYLFTVTLINIGVGLAVGTGVALLGMPNPMLWGALACVLTYVPYLGAAVGIGVLAFASVLTFDDLGRALAVPAVYVVVSFLEGNFVTPAVLGQRLTLNPVVIFIGLLFWFFLWGIPGALLAVPTIVIFKIVCDHVEGLAAIGEFFGPKDES
jgi:predicted PurR-regulated permease PerM